MTARCIMAVVGLKRTFLMTFDGRNVKETTLDRQSTF